MVSPPGFQSPSSVPLWKNLTGSSLLKQKWQKWLIEHHKAQYRKVGLELRNNSFVISTVFLRLSQWQLAQCGLIWGAQCYEQDPISFIILMLMIVPYT